MIDDSLNARKIVSLLLLFAQFLASKKQTLSNVSAKLMTSIRPNKNPLEAKFFLISRAMNLYKNRSWKKNGCAPKRTGTLFPVDFLSSVPLLVLIDNSRNGIS